MEEIDGHYYSEGEPIQRFLFELDDFIETGREETLRQYRSCLDYIDRLTSMEPSDFLKGILKKQSFEYFMSLRLDADLLYLPRPDFEIKWYPTKESNG